VWQGWGSGLLSAMGFGLYKILFHFEALLHNNIFLQTPPLLCNILHNITSYCTPPPDFAGVWRCLEVFFC